MYMHMKEQIPNFLNEIRSISNCNLMCDDYYFHHFLGGSDFIDTCCKHIFLIWQPRRHDEDTMQFQACNAILSAMIDIGRGNGGLG